MENDIASQTSDLRRHLGLGERDGMPKSPPEYEPLFFVEISPSSTRAAKCKLVSCNEAIESGRYRIAMTPAMSGPAYYASKNADFYHVACFEQIADLSKVDFLDRISPMTRFTAGGRNLQGKSILNGNYLCEGGIERLVLEWKVQRGRWIDESEGREIEAAEGPFFDLLRMAGSSQFKASGPPPEMTMHEYIYLLDTLAPYESDGPEDTEEWNLFDTFLSKDKESWHDRHDLSKMLTKWEQYREIATSDDHHLNEHEKELKTRIGEKGLRAIKRLAVVPMPDVQAAFMRGIRW